MSMSGSRNKRNNQLKAQRIISGGIIGSAHQRHRRREISWLSSAKVKLARHQPGEIMAKENQRKWRGEINRMSCGVISAIAVGARNGRNNINIAQ